MGRDAGPLWAPWWRCGRPMGAGAGLFRDCHGHRLRPADVAGMLLETAPEASMGQRSLLRAWRTWADRVKGGFAQDQAHLYVHVPYCRRRCAYCDLHSGALRSRSQLDAFVEHVSAQARAFRPALSGVRFRSVLVGGGSPSMLSAEQLRGCFSTVISCLRPREDAALCFECAPESVTWDRLVALKDLGFNRLSMGVQTFDAGLLRKAGRGQQGPAVIARAVKLLRKAGFRHGFNLDILAGMRGQDAGDVLASFRRMAGLGPTQITVNKLRPPQGYGSDDPAFSARVRSLLERSVLALPRLARSLGYAYAPLCGENRPCAEEPDWVFSLKLPDGTVQKHGAWYVGHEDSRPPMSRNSILGLGPGSSSHIAGWLTYREGIASERFGRELDPKAQGVWHLLSRLEDRLPVSMRLLSERLGKEAGAAAEPFARSLCAAGLATSERGRLRLTRRRKTLPCLCSVKAAWFSERLRPDRIDPAACRRP